MARDLMLYFRAEARELVQKLSQDTLSFEKAPSAELLLRLLRHAHTLKGAARVVRQQIISEAIHEFEGLLADHRAEPEATPREAIDQLLALLDRIAEQVSLLESAAAPAAAPPTGKPEGKPEAKPASTVASADGEDGGLSLLSHQGLEVDSLLEDLRAASTQLEGVRRTLHGVERSKTLSELLLAQLASESGQKTARFVAEELQAQLRSVERSLAFGLDQMERDLHQVQESTEKLRLVKAEALFPVLRRVLRDATERGSLQAELRTSGGDLRLEAGLLASVQGALIQAVRNSVAHGIEPAEERARRGKSPTGVITLGVSREGRDVVFRCRDDGRGVDFAGLRRGLEAFGVSVQGLDNDGLLELVMKGGVSTSSSVSQTSGRGIGMDVIREVASALGGRASVQSREEEFTEVVLRLPWTVAGMEFLEMWAHAPGQEEHIVVLLPLDCVLAALRLKSEEISRDAEGQTILHEGEGLRLLSLNGLLGISQQSGLAAVVVQTAEGRLALSTGSLRGARTATLLPLPSSARASAYIAGAALNADGDAMLVLDHDGLLAESRRIRSAPARDEGPGLPLLVIDDSLTTRMLQQSILESAGFEVDLASSAEQGLERIAERTYGLALCDVEMPGMDGFAFVTVLRSGTRQKDLPVILVTSRDAPEDKLRGQSVGAQGYMVKSEFDQKALLRQIRGLL